jgi:hypothetical protein
MGWSRCSGGLIGDQPPWTASPWCRELVCALRLHFVVVDRRRHCAQVLVCTGIRYQMNSTEIETCLNFNSSNFLSNLIILSLNRCNSMNYSCNFSQFAWIIEFQSWGSVLIIETELILTFSIDWQVIFSQNLIVNHNCTWVERLITSIVIGEDSKAWSISSSINCSDFYVSNRWIDQKLEYLNNQLEMQETERSNDLRPVQLYDCGAGRSLGLWPAPISTVCLLHPCAN